MYENTAKRILKAQNGDEEEMTKLIEENNRLNLEHSKKIHRKRIRDRRLVSNRMYGLYKINKKV